MEINDIKKEYTKKINGRFKKNKNIRLSIVIVNALIVIFIKSKLFSKENYQVEL